MEESETPNLVVSTHLKNMSQIGSCPQIEMEKILETTNQLSCIQTAFQGKPTTKIAQHKFRLTKMFWYKLSVIGGVFAGNPIGKKQEPPETNSSHLPGVRNGNNPSSNHPFSGASC